MAKCDQMWCVISYTREFTAKKHNKMWSDGAVFARQSRNKKVPTTTSKDFL
jgi:hypothetical protein